jgi:superoxide oxidase
MNISNTSSRYEPISIALHWVMVLLIVAVYACIELRELFPKGSDPREALKMWHFMLGLSIFVLVWARIIAMMTGHVPPIVPELPLWQKLLAKAVHGALYLLMIGLPLVGWFLLSAAGKPIPFFGLDLPALISENKDLAHTLKELHETGGTIGYFLIGLHAVAALFHHYFVRDNTLMRMLPKRD